MRRNTRHGGNSSEVAASLVFIDGSAVVRNGLRAILEVAGFMIVGEAAAADEAAALLTHAAPCVALTALRLGPLDVPNILPAWRRISPRTSFILFSDRLNRGVIARALRAGASDCLSKKADPDEIIETVARCAERPAQVDRESICCLPRQTPT